MGVFSENREVQRLVCRRGAPLSLFPTKNNSFHKSMLLRKSSLLTTTHLERSDRVGAPPREVVTAQRQRGARPQSGEEEQEGHLLLAFLKLLAGS